MRVRVDGQVRELSEEIKLNKQQWHDIEVIVDRLVIRPDTETVRLTESVEAALKLSGGTVVASIVGGEDVVYSEQFACVHCDISIAELEPRNFSFNAVRSVPTCTGLGFRLEVDPDLVIPDKSLSLAAGAVAPWARSGANPRGWHPLCHRWRRRTGFRWTSRVATRNGGPADNSLRSRQQRIEVAHTTQRGRVYRWETTFEGVIPSLERRHVETESENVREDIARYMARRPCVTCGGDRLKPEALAVTVLGMSVMEVTRQSVHRALDWVEACRDGQWPDGSDARRAACDARGGDRIADIQGDRIEAGVPVPRGPRLPYPRPSSGHAERGRGPGESGWRPRSARDSWACSTFATNRRSACTLWTTTG